MVMNENQQNRDKSPVVSQDGEIKNRISVSVERTQQQEVELDLDEITDFSAIQEAIEEKCRRGEWKNVGPAQIMNISMSMEAYAVKAYSKDEDSLFNLLVIAESKEAARSLAVEYMNFPEKSMIAIERAEPEYLVKYINDIETFTFESVIDLDEFEEDDYENDY